MLGLMLAGLYVACSVLFSNTAPVAAIENSLSFLWYWHMTFAVVKVLFWAIIPMIGLGVTATNEKGVGLAILLASPFLLILMLFSSFLYLIGVYAMQSGMDAGQVISQSHVVIGVTMYGFGMLADLLGRVSNTKD